MKSFPGFPLSAKARKFVQSSIASGRYESPKQVLEEALTLLEREHEEIRKGIHRGIEAADRGEVRPLEGVLDRVRNRVAARSRAVRRRKSA